MIIAAIVAIVIVLLLLLLRSCLPSDTDVVATAEHPRRPGAMLSLGDAVMTGFSGTVAPDPARKSPAGLAAIDQTFIATGGPSARIYNPRTPNFVWDGRYWAAPRTHDIPASAVGQVFGVAIDDAEYPDIYLTATSLYGLNLVVPPPRDADPKDKAPRRTRNGRSDASWMAGQFGPGGGPGSIWKIDGKSGHVTRFADLGSGPAALGNVTYDAAHHQLFVSDLSSGMIVRLGLDGKALGQFDHGVTGRAALHLAPVADNRDPHADPHDAALNTEDPASWGFAPVERRVFGLAVHGGRLYYAVADGRIWSVALDKDGAFTPDVRWEIDLPDKGTGPAVSDMVFTHSGTMIVAERAVTGTRYDYHALPPDGVAHVYRFTPEKPNDPATPSAWYQLPEEYAVGFAGDSRESAGGVALGYGYKDDGTIDFTGCEDALFLTGDTLRDFRTTPTGFSPGGPFQLYGLQVGPSGPVRGFNTPPAISYFVNYSEQMGSADAHGTIGDVKVYRVDCKEPGCVTPAPTGPLTALPPTSTTRVAAVPVAPPGTGTPTTGTPTDCAGSPGCGPPCTPGEAGCGPPCTPGGPGCGSPCIPGTVGCPVPCIPGTAGCPIPCTPGLPGCPTGGCVPGTPGCPNPSNAICMDVTGTATCDTTTGKWTYAVTTTDPQNIGMDTITAYSTTPGVSVSNGPDIPLSPATMDLTGASAGQSINVDICAFKNSDRYSGAPYDCCHQVVKIHIPNTVCAIGSSGSSGSGH